MKGLKFLVFLLAMLSLVGCVSAAVQFTITDLLPGDSGELSKHEYNISVNLTNTTAGVEILSTNFSITDSAGTVIWNKTNTSHFSGEVDNMTATIRLDTVILSDTESYTITIRAYNTTGGLAAGLVATSTMTAVTVDNTNPTCSISDPDENNEKFYDVTLTASADNATTCYFVANNKEIVGTISGANDAEICSGTLHKGDVPEGRVVLKAVTKDSSATADVTSCSIVNFIASSERTAVRGAVIDADEQDLTLEQWEQGGNTKLVKIVIIGVIAYLGYLTIVKKKKLF